MILIKLVTVRIFFSSVNYRHLSSWTLCSVFVRGRTHIQLNKFSENWQSKNSSCEGLIRWNPTNFNLKKKFQQLVYLSYLSIIWVQQLTCTHKTIWYTQLFWNFGILFRKGGDWDISNLIQGQLTWGVSLLSTDNFEPQATDIHRLLLFLCTSFYLLLFFLFWKSLSFC